MRSPYTTFHRFQSTAYQPKNARVSSRSHKDVVMLFCPSFTQSERFLHTDQIITRLQVVVHDKLHSCMFTRNRDRERVQVRCSDWGGQRSSELAFHGSQELLKCPCTAQSSQTSNCTFYLLLWSLVHQPVPSTRAHQNSDKPWLCFLEDAYTGYHVFSTEPLTQTAIPE